MGDVRGAAVDVHEDGTFVLYSKDGQERHGQWHLNSHLLDTGIELDGNTFADEYRLARRGYGVLCIEVRRDYEYWCRTSK